MFGGRVAGAMEIAAAWFAALEDVGIVGHFGGR